MATPSKSRESCAMSGERYLLDTNAIVCLLRGDKALHRRLHSAEWVGISILSQIEFLAFPSLARTQPAVGTKKPAIGPAHKHPGQQKGRPQSSR